jgi:MFS family permease
MTRYSYGMSDSALPNPLKDKNLLLSLGLIIFIQLGISSIIPILPLMSDELGLSLGKVSLVVAAYTMPSIFLTPFAGYLADRFGRKEILIPSLLFYSITGTGCALAPSFSMLIWLRLLQGISVATFGVLFSTIIGDLYSGKERVRNMGYITTTFSACTAVIPLVGGLLALIHWRLPFALPIFGFVYANLAFKHLYVPNPNHTPDTRSYLANIKKSLFLHHGLILYSITLLASAGSFGAYQIYMPKLVNVAFSGSPAQIGSMLTLSALVSGVISTQLVAINTLFSKRSMLLASFIVYIISIGMMPFAGTYWGLAIPMALSGLAQGMSYSTILMFLSEASSAAQRGSIMAINASMLTLGQSIAPYILLLPYMAGGTAWAFITAASIMAGCVWLALRLPQTHRQ